MSEYEALAGFDVTMSYELKQGDNAKILRNRV